MRLKGGHLFGAKSKVGGADDFALTHRDAACDLGQVFAECDLVDQLFDFTEAPFGLQACGPFLHLAQALGIGRKPCQTVGGGLLTFDQRDRELAVFADARAQSLAGGVEQRLDRGEGGAGNIQQIGHQQGGGHGGVLSIVGHESRPFSGVGCW